MAATNPNALAGEAKCYFCFGQVSLVQGLRLALLARTLLAVSPAADTSPQALITYAKCYGCYTYASLGDMMELALRDQIAQAI